MAAARRCGGGGGGGRRMANNKRPACGALNRRHRVAGDGAVAINGMCCVTAVRDDVSSVRLFTCKAAPLLHIFHALTAAHTRRHAENIRRLGSLVRWKEIPAPGHAVRACMLARWRCSKRLQLPLWIEQLGKRQQFMSRRCAFVPLRSAAPSRCIYTALLYRYGGRGRRVDSTSLGIKRKHAHLMTRWRGGAASVHRRGGEHQRAMVDDRLCAGRWLFCLFSLLPSPAILFCLPPVSFSTLFCRGLPAAVRCA